MMVSFMGFFRMLLEFSFLRVFILLLFDGFEGGVKV